MSRSEYPEDPFEYPMDPIEYPDEPSEYPILPVPYEPDCPDSPEPFDNAED